MALKYALKSVVKDDKVAYYYDVTQYVEQIVGTNIIKVAMCYIDSISTKAYDKLKLRERKLGDITRCCEVIDKKFEENGFFTFSVYERLEFELVNGNKFCIDMRTYSSASSFGVVNLKKGVKNTYEN